MTLTATTAPTAAALTDAIAAYQAARGRAYGRPLADAAHEAVEDALDRVNRLAAAILTAPARTPEAIRAKAAALAWELDGEPAEGFHIDAHRAAAVRGLLADLAGQGMAI